MKLKANVYYVLMEPTYSLECVLNNAHQRLHCVLKGTKPVTNNVQRTITIQTHQDIVKLVETQKNTFMSMNNSHSE